MYASKVLLQSVIARELWERSTFEQCYLSWSKACEILKGIENTFSHPWVTGHVYNPKAKNEIYNSIKTNQVNKKC